MAEALNSALLTLLTTAHEPASAEFRTSIRVERIELGPGRPNRV